MKKSNWRKPSTPPALDINWRKSSEVLIVGKNGGLAIARYYDDQERHGWYDKFGLKLEPVLWQHIERWK